MRTPRLRGIPQRVHLGERGIRRLLARGRERILDRREPALEFQVCRAQRTLGIDIEVAREIDDREQQIADLARDFLLLSAIELVCDLVGFLANFRQHRLRVVPVEADLAGLLLQLERTRERGQAGRNAGEGAVAAGGRGLARLHARGFLLRLDLIPLNVDLVGRQPAFVAEHVRMTADQLLGDRLHHVAERERALLLGHAGVEHDLQQQVAQFVLQVVEVAAADRVGHLVGFLDGVGRDGREILLEVPRAAAAGRAQRRHDLDQPGDVAGGFHAGLIGWPVAIAASCSGRSGRRFPRQTICRSGRSSRKSWP